MFGSAINSTLAGIGARELTDYAIAAMLVVFGIAWLSSVFGRWRRMNAQTATILTSIGILGTFAGIVVGLYGFDASPATIDDSIQGLLAGLTTAFTSSLVGMALAVLWKLWSAMSPGARDRARADAPYPTAPTLATLVELTTRQADEIRSLREAIVGETREPLCDLVATASRTMDGRLAEVAAISKAGQRLLEEQRDTLERVRQSLADDAEASLPGQLRGLRAELVDRERNRRAEFETTTRSLETQSGSLHELLTETRRAVDVHNRVATATAESAQAGATAAKALGDALPDIRESARELASRSKQVEERQEQHAGRLVESVGTVTAALDRIALLVGDGGESGLAGRLDGLRVDVNDGFGLVGSQVERLSGSADRGLLLQEETLAVSRAQENSVDQVRVTLGDGLKSGLESRLEDVRQTLVEVFERNHDLVSRIGDGADRRTELHREQLDTVRAQQESLLQLGASVGDADGGGVVGELRELRELSRNAANDHAERAERLERITEAGQGTRAEQLHVARDHLQLSAQGGSMAEGRLREIVELLSRSPTEEIIDALKTTIREFNEHIAEQFGDNFKQLNQAVGNLLVWQSEYRDRLEEMGRQYDASVRSLDVTERSVASIAESGGAIPAQMERLATILETNDAKLRELETHLEAFASARDRAVAAVPEISRIVDDTVTGLSKAGSALTEGVEGSATSMTNAVERSVRNYVDATDRVNENVQAVTQRTHDETVRLFSSLEKSIEEAYRNSSESVKQLVIEQSTHMGEARRKETDDVMQDMGVALASITRKFTEDYAQLVQEMDRVIRDQPRRDAA